MSNFNVVAGDSVFNIVIRKPNPIQSKVDLVNRDQTITLGYVLKDTSGITPNWWAYGYYPNITVYPGSFPREKTRGFATRRLAIYHMLYRCGWWD